MYGDHQDLHVLTHSFPTRRSSDLNLLEWMFDGLIADGVVSQSDASSMYEAGETVLKFGGASVKQTSSSYNYANLIDNGFASVTMATDIADPERISRKRSEEHTSELQSLMRISYAVFCLKKK